MCSSGRLLREESQRRRVHDGAVFSSWRLRADHLYKAMPSLPARISLGVRFTAPASRGFSPQRLGPQDAGERGGSSAVVKERGSLAVASGGRKKDGRTVSGKCRPKETGSPNSRPPVLSRSPQASQSLPSSIPQSRGMSISAGCRWRHPQFFSIPPANLAPSAMAFLEADLRYPNPAAEARKHKLKRLVPTPNSFFMDVKCPGCWNITTVFSHAQSVVLCGSCSTVLCTPTGGKCRLTEGCSFRRKN